MSSKVRMPTAEETLAGRPERMAVPERHHVLQTPMAEPFPQEMRLALFGMGCFWGAERKFWEAKGVYSTQVGYAGGFTPNPTYEEVCTGRTGHNEVVRVVFDAQKIRYTKILQIFWENHDPTQGMRQGNDIGTQYRSGIYYYDEAQRNGAETSRQVYQGKLEEAGLGPISTEIREAPEFYYAEKYHQQYLAKNPQGYCGLGGTGISCPTGIDIPG